MKAPKAVRFYPNVAAYRQYFRALGDLKSELESFCLQGTHCMCCQRGRTEGSGFTGWGFGLRVLGFGFRGSGLGIRV